ncbi:hypothetical protein FTN76_04695 [Chlamydia trachomatis]|nr:hypothetical protein CTL2C_371 [Chlamydia trachomatis L2c]AGJ65005.1 hypothetical protein CTLINITIAL_04630 [Chlamydia trachomatis L2/434/Bu(i)]AGJ65946.1 hypothetical protein CTLFINAL_04635 [Chlamydia trachomatis L2/434/Bu(f)]AGR94984.1 hypothetical protein CTRC46_03290 [Chlamydia trachomatis RC-L2(s)/46]AGR96863.1 hypothetical protein CTRC943_03275 [Chlamydia trachomatis RC-J/943]AGR98704.1 hypothetical protein CTRC3_03315 [Chlamydia trachomatis RC-L2(s)/3]AGS04324.1 hypothetical protein 
MTSHTTDPWFVFYYREVLTEISLPGTLDFFRKRLQISYLHKHDRNQAKNYSSGRIFFKNTVLFLEEKDVLRD